MDNYETAWRALKQCFIGKKDKESYEQMICIELEFGNSDINFEMPKELEQELLGKEKKK